MTPRKKPVRRKKVAPASVGLTVTETHAAGHAAHAALASQGIKRRIALVTPHFIAALAVVAGQVWL